MQQALAQMQPPIRVSAKAASVWLTKYKVPEGAQVVASADAFEQQYGHSMRHLSVEYPTAYKFSLALRKCH